MIHWILNSNGLAIKSSGNCIVFNEVPLGAYVFAFGLDGRWGLPRPHNLEHQESSLTYPPETTLKPP